MSAVVHAPPPAAAVVHPPPGANPPQQAAGLAATGEQVLAAAKEKSEAKARNVWLHAWHDPVAGLKAYSQCVRLADLNANGESKLLVAGSDKKLKIYQGTTLRSENVLLDAPVSVVVFYPDANKPRTPSVTEPAPWVASYRKRRAKKVREPRVPNHAGYDEEVAALSRRSIVERLEGWTDDGYTKGFDAGYVN